MIKRPFEQWLFEDVEIEFGIDRVYDFQPLLDWINVPNPIPLDENKEKLRLSLLKDVETWNEDELKMMFIAPFLKEFDFNHPPIYRVFTQRLMSLT
jgi:predicted PP-loop superfamily ATPase